MNTQLNAMKQALEALEAILGTLTLANEQELIADTIWFSNHETLFDYITSEIDALRTSIEAAEAQAAPVHDSTCNETLHAQGKGYPRTCKKCGFGPCFGTPKQPPAAPTVQEPVALLDLPLTPYHRADGAPLWDTHHLHAYALRYSGMLTTPPAAQPAPVQQKPLFADIIAQHPGLAEELKAMDAAPVQEPVGRVCFEGDEVVWTGEPPESGTLLYTHSLPAAPVQDEHQAFIDSLPKDGDDKMYMQIHHWARQSYKRHQSSVRGQMITAADASDTHIIWAALRWAKENTPPSAQRPVPLTDEQIDAAINAWFTTDIVGSRQPFERRMRAAFAAAHGITEKGQPAACSWTQVDDEHTPDTWQADCGAVWTFTEGGPADNDMKFCPKCGKIVEQKGGAA